MLLHPATEPWQHNAGAAHSFKCQPLWGVVPWAVPARASRPSWRQSALWHFL